MGASEPSWEASTRAQYDDDTNLAARQALFAHLVEATPLAWPLDDLSALANRRVLDIGCGNGMFLAAAASGGAQAVGLDLSPGMVTTARQTAGAPGVVADAHALPIASGSVDVVLALWMLYHVDDRPRALTDIRRVLADGGLLVATTNSGRHSELDDLACQALSDVLGTDVDQWHPPLPFDAENGADILGSVFDRVETHPFANRFEVPDVDVLVRYVGSMLGPIQELHGPLDTTALLLAVGQRCEAVLATSATIGVARAGAVFIAR